MDLSLMVSVPHRSCNKNKMTSDAYLHYSNACCEVLMKNACSSGVNGKTVIFVPYIAIESEVYQKIYMRSG